MAKTKQGVAGQPPAIIGVWGAFTAGQVSEILQVSRRKILLYIEQGLLEAAFDARGRGRVRRFSVSDLFKISIIRALENFGVAPRVMQQLLEPIPMQVSVPNGEISYFRFLVVYENETGEFGFEYTNELADFESGGRPAFIVINIDALMPDILNRVAAVERETLGL